MCPVLQRLCGTLWSLGTLLSLNFRKLPTKTDDDLVLYTLGWFVLGESVKFVFLGAATPEAHSMANVIWTLLYLDEGVFVIIWIQVGKDEARRIGVPSRVLMHFSWCFAPIITRSVVLTFGYKSLIPRIYSINFSLRFPPRFRKFAKADLLQTS